MSRKKSQSLGQLKALRKVRKPLPPPARMKEDEKKYRRASQRRVVQREVEREAEEE